MEKRSNGEGTFIKRSDGRLEYRASFGRNSDGKVERKSFYGKNKTECIHKYKKYLDQRNKQVLSADITLYDWALRYIHTYRSDVKPPTFAHYLSIIENYINPSPIGHMPLYKIKPMQIQSLLKEHANLSKSHLGKMRDLLSSAFECAIDNELCTKNPCKNISVDNRVKRASLDNTFTMDECSTIRDHCLNSSNRTAFAALILLYTGMRQGELLGLQWNDVDFENNCIHITRTSCVDERCRKYIADRTKTDGSTRDVYILPQLKDILINRPKSSLFIVSTRSGDFYNANSFNKMHKRFIRSIPNIRPLGTHAYRHALITHLGNAGASLDDIARIVGHDDPSLTRKVYFFNDGSRSKLAMAKLPY